MKKLKNIFLFTLCFLFTVFSTITFAVNPDDLKHGSSSDDEEAACTTSGITIKKVDSVTLAGLENAEFELSKDNNFSGMTFILKTDKNGVAIKNNLSPGKWFLREKTAPKGYIKYTEKIEVTIGDSMKTITLKNTPYGKINILKKDSEGKAVSGAVFTLYKGSQVDPEKIFKDNLTSNEKGEIFIDEIEPETYTLLEKEAAPGYHLNSSPVTKEVVAGKTTVFEIENVKIRKCALKIYKKDAETKEQLAGAKFGVYADPEFNNLVTTIESIKEGPAKVENLDPGTYYVKELSVPEGYLLDAPSQSITLSEGQEAELTFENSKNIPTAGNFGSKITIGLSLLTLSSIFAAYGLFYFRKKSNVA